MARGPWYWCLQHAAVEPESGCPNDRRMGPYDSFDEAEHAIDRARERTEEMDRADQEWSSGE